VTKPAVALEGGGALSLPRPAAVRVLAAAAAAAATQAETRGRVPLAAAGCCMLQALCTGVAGCC